HTPMKETDARGKALEYLVGKGADILWQVDSDEPYTEANITSILAFLDRTPTTSWYRLSLKNHVFDTEHYLEDPFTPPRIHRVHTTDSKGRPLVADHFSGDNDIAYKGELTFTQSLLPNLTIPKTVAFIRHLTWLNDERSRRKVLYQTQGRGWE